MPKSKRKSSRLVFSTETGNCCPNCSQPEAQCQCIQNKPGKNDDIVRISRQTKGRRGKAVTIISGILLKEEELKVLTKSLKKVCGTGGAIKNQTIEIQGDQREKCKVILERTGYIVKLAGG